MNKLNIIPIVEATKKLHYLKGLFNHFRDEAIK